MMTAYKLQIPDIADCWKTFLFDENHQIFAPVSPFMDKERAALEAGILGVQLAYYLDELFAPLEFIESAVDEEHKLKIRLLGEILKKDFAADSLRQPNPEVEENVVVKTVPENEPAPEAFH